MTDVSDVSGTDRRTPAQHALAEHLRLTAVGQVTEWVKLFADNGALELPYAPAGVTRRVVGRDALLEHMSHFPETFNVQFLDLRFHDTVDEHLAIAEFRSEGTALPTGKAYEQECISVVWTDDDGLITRYVDYWNPLTVIEALTPDDAVSEPTADIKFGS